MHVCEGKGHGVEIKGSGGGERMFTDKEVLKLDFEVSVEYFRMKKGKEPPKQREWREKRRGQRLDIQATARVSILPEQRVLGASGAVGWGLED